MAHMVRIWGSYLGRKKHYFYSDAQTKMSKNMQFDEAAVIYINKK